MIDFWLKSPLNSHYALVDPIEAAKSGKLHNLMPHLLTQLNKDYCCKLGYSLLHYCAMYGHEKLVGFLIGLGANLNTTANGGITPLHQAVYSGNLACVELLVRAGADIHAVDCKGHSPLHAAARFGHSVIAHFLLKAGANAQYRDRYGFTALDEAIKYRQRHTIAVLIDFSEASL